LHLTSSDLIADRMWDPMSYRDNLRVAFIAGSLGQGGAEKQLLYLARELRRVHVDVRVLTLTRGEACEPAFAEAGVPVEWAGRHRLPLRLADLAFATRRFRPHIVQASHFFTNLYAVGLARVSGAACSGTIRNDTHFDMEECGRWGTPLLRAPRSLIANSRTAARAAQAAGVDASRLHVLANVIDLEQFDRQAGPRRAIEGELHRGGADILGCTGARKVYATREAGERDVIAVAVARLVPAKRLDRFLRALARARRDEGRLRGLIVGDGPERARLEAIASGLGLLPDGVRFLGACADVPRVLAGADMLVLTSQHEGFPNVLLEGMAARLPIIATPAGDAEALVDDGRTGFVVPFQDLELLTERMLTLTRSAATRRRFGAAGRARVEAHYRVDGLAGRALEIYHRIAARQHRARTLRAFDALAR
jgi:glycosyltransferase involved in cell wall biosynthesis